MSLLPVYFVAGFTGTCAGALVILLLAVWTGLSLTISAAICALACATFISFGMLRARLLRQQKIVLLEHFLLVEGLAFAALHALGIAPLPYLDLLTTGLATFMVFGRLGCFLSGCCYGISFPVGVSYPVECGHRSRTRRLPTQLIESAVWAVFALLSLAAVLLRPAGTALFMVLTGYGVLRLVLEPLRGDPRKRYLGLTEAAWLSILSLGIAAYFRESSLELGLVTTLGTAAFALVVPLVLAKTSSYWLALDESSDARAAVAAIAGEMKEHEIGIEPVVRTLGPLTFAASYTRDEVGIPSLNVSVSSRSRRLDRSEASQLLEWMSHGLGVDVSDVRPVLSEKGVYLATLRADVNTGA